MTLGFSSLSRSFITVYYMVYTYRDRPYLTPCVYNSFMRIAYMFTSHKAKLKYFL